MDLFEWAREGIDIREMMERHESLPVSAVLDYFGIPAKPGHIVTFKTKRMGVFVVRLSNDDKHWFQIVGSGYEGEFETLPNNAFGLLVYFGLDRREHWRWACELFRELKHRHDQKEAI